MPEKYQVDIAEELRKTVAKLNGLVRTAADINLQVKLTQGAYELENPPGDKTGWADIKVSVTLTEEL